MLRQDTGGAQRHLLTVAASRPWRDSKRFAAPGLPKRGKDTIVRIKDEGRRMKFPPLLISQLRLQSKHILIFGTDGSRAPNSMGMGPGAP